MDKKVKVFFAAMGIATALLVSVSASADNSDSKVQVSIDITWDSLEFTYTDGQWDPETHSYKGGGWSDSGGNFTVKNNGNVGVETKFSPGGMKKATGRELTSNCAKCFPPPFSAEATESRWCRFFQTRCQTPFTPTKSTL